MRPTPQVEAWVREKAAAGNYFAGSLQRGMARYGGLTPNQHAAVERAIIQDAARIQATLEVKAAAPTFAGAGFERLLGSFAKAKANGLKRPKLTTGDVAFSLAPDTGKNPGFVYIKLRGQYAAKVSPEGRLFMAYTAPAGLKEGIEAIGADPLAAAIAHGKESGSCAICMRQLTDPESVERGIGPICAKKFGWE